MGCRMFLVKSSGLSFLNSSHSVTRMQQSAFWRHWMVDVAYWILFLKMFCFRCCLVVVVACFCVFGQAVLGCFFEANLKKFAGCVYYRLQESEYVCKRRSQHASNPKNLFKDCVAERKPRTSPQTGEVAVQIGHRTSSEGHCERC